MNKIEQSFTEKYDTYLSFIVQFLLEKHNISVKRGTNTEGLPSDILHDIFIRIKNNHIQLQNPFIYILNIIRNELCSTYSFVYTTYIYPIKFKSDFDFSKIEYKEPEEEIEEKPVDENIIEKLKAKAEGYKKISSKKFLQSTLFVYYFFNDMTYRLIAKKTKINKNAVCSEINELKKEFTIQEINILKAYKKTIKNKKKI